MAKSKAHVTVSFAPGVRGDLLWRAEIRAGVGNHEIAILDFRNKAGDIAPPDGTRVQVTFGASPQWSKTFYGYVNHAERIDSGGVKEANTYRVFCVGPSKPMNNANPGRWAGVTESFIARSIAQRYAMRSVLTKGTTLVDWVQSSNETDFKMLNRLAQQAGAFFWVSGSTLNFVDPSDRIITAASQSVQTFTRTYPVLKNPNDTLREMRLIRGADAPGIGSPTVASAFGLDPSTGALIKATGLRSYGNAGLSTPGTSSIYSGSVQSAAEATAVTSSGIFASTWSQMDVDVWVRNTPVYVGDVVNLAGTGVATSEQGLWFTSNTLEVLEYRDASFGYDYTANLRLTRNQSDSHVTRTTKNLTGASPVVPSVWVGNRWQSQTLESVYV
jgi:hypothetical protein